MVETKIIHKQDVWDVLDSIVDPDIPVISIVELGLVRDVQIEEEKVLVSITPSYSSCPAMYYFKEEIPRKLSEAGIAQAEVKVLLSPAWTTDWLTDAAREKMKKHGIAPPAGQAGGEIVLRKHVACPWCGQQDTELRSQFGSTPCKALWFCKSCAQPFEYFKCY